MYCATEFVYRNAGKQEVLTSIFVWLFIWVLSQDMDNKGDADQAGDHISARLGDLHTGELQ